MAGTPREIDRSNVDERLPAFRAYVTQILRRLNCPDPENAASEVLFRAREAIVGKALTLNNPAAWLARACYNYARQQRRKRVNREEQIPEHFQASTDPPDFPLLFDIQAELRRLGDRDRRLLLSSPKPREQLAREFNMTVQGVTQKLARLRKKFADAIGYQRNKRLPPGE